MNPVCAASRMSILTGRYSHSHGTMSNYHETPRTFASFPQTLRAHGYQTACFGHLHIKGRDDLDWDIVNPKRDWPPPPEGVTDRNLNPFAGWNVTGQPMAYEERYSGTWRIKEESNRFLKEQATAPWFMQSSLYKPHTPYRTTWRM
jgi:arylsulfatase A-like enzyme